MLESLIAGLEKLFFSRKFLTAVIGVVVMGLSMAFKIDPALLDAVKWLLLALIGTWTIEDTARAIASRGVDADRLDERIDDLEGVVFELKAKKK